MMQKRLFCAVLALVLLLSAQPAAAMAVPPNGRSLEITADCRIPIIQVTVPTSATVYINPLELPVRVGTSKRQYAQIISTPTCIANQSEVPMGISLTVTASVKEESTMNLVSSPTGGSGTEKNAFVYLEIQQSDTYKEKLINWDSAYDPSSDRHIVLKDGESVTKEDVLTLSAMTPKGKVAPGGYAPFRLTGDAVKEPTDKWTSDDGINVIVAFTFTPLYHEN